MQEIQSLLGLRDEDIANIEERFSPESSESKSEIFTEEKVIETSSQNDEIELLSDKNVDYSKLRDFLANGEWKDADMETTRCMLKVAEREEKGYLDVEDIENFPCTDLRTIDQLWVKYSDGKFGFSVQKKIYQSLGGTEEYSRKVWEKFGEKVGWIKGDRWLSYDELTWIRDTLAHYTGHLPGVGVSFNWAKGFRGRLMNNISGPKRVVCISSLARRLVDCKI